MSLASFITNTLVVRFCQEEKLDNFYAMKKWNKLELLCWEQVKHVKAKRNLLAKVGSYNTVNSFIPIKVSNTCI